MVALWAAEALTDKTVLVLVPSLALLRQTLKEWVEQTRWDPYDYLCVCSDHTVNKGKDELLIQPTELEFSVTSKPEEVSRFLGHRFGGTKIIFWSAQRYFAVRSNRRWTVSVAYRNPEPVSASLLAELDAPKATCFSWPPSSV